MNRGMSPWRGWAIAGVTAAAVTVAASGAPLALRHVDGFRVVHVHVTGAGHLSSADAIAASGITSRSSVFDEFEPWRDALERHPLVLRARVSRQLPSTIVLAITETEPIALVREEELRPVDARGRVLPIGVAQLEHDLPVVNAEVTADEAGPRIDTAGVRLVQAFARIRKAEPWLAAWTCEISALPDGVRLTVDWPAGAEVLLSATDADVLEAIRLTVLDLASSVKADSGDADAIIPTSGVGVNTVDAPGPALAAIGVRARLMSRGVGAELRRLDRVDARFREQVVVTLREAGRASGEEIAR